MVLQMDHDASVTEHSGTVKRHISTFLFPERTLVVTLIDSLVSELEELSVAMLNYWRLVLFKYTFLKFL